MKRFYPPARDTIQEEFTVSELHFTFHFDEAVYLTPYSRTGYDFMDGAKYLCDGNERLSRLVGEYLSIIRGYWEEAESGNEHFRHYYWHRLVSVVSRLQNQYAGVLFLLDKIQPVFIPDRLGNVLPYYLSSFYPQ